MSREGGDKNSKTQAEQTAQLEELINAYNHGGQDKNESERIRSEKIERRKENLDVSREKLLKNGVPIDPDLVEEVTGGDRSNITIPKAELNQNRESDNTSRGSHAKSVQQDSTRSTINIIHASSGEEIISDSRAVGQTKDSELVDDVNLVDDENISTRETKRRRREINKAINKARRKYGHDNYNRLDPNDYEPEKIVERKKMRTRTQLRRMIVVIIILIILAGVAGAIVCRVMNLPLNYVVNYCTEQDVIDAIQNYNNGDVQAITSYLADKVGDEQYSQDAKCAYIGALEFALNGVESGVQYQQGRFDSSTDKESVDELITRYGGPTMDSLNNTANDKSGGDEGDDVPSQDRTLLEEPVSGEVPN